MEEGKRLCPIQPVLFLDIIPYTTAETASQSERRLARYQVRVEEF